MDCGIHPRKLSRAKRIDESSGVCMCDQYFFPLAVFPNIEISTARLVAHHNTGTFTPG